MQQESQDKREKNIERDTQVRRLEESIRALTKRAERASSIHKSRKSRSGETFSDQELGVGEYYQ